MCHLKLVTGIYLVKTSAVSEVEIILRTKKQTEEDEELKRTQH